MQQAVRFFLDDGVTLTTQLFKPGPIQNCDVSAVIFDYTLSLQLAGSFCDAFAPDTQHVGNQFLGHGQAVVRQAIHRKQQPAAQLLIDRVVPVADCGLGHLRNQGLRIS